jgi:hypothetical protein
VGGSVVVWKIRIEDLSGWTRQFGGVELKGVSFIQILSSDMEWKRNIVIVKMVVVVGFVVFVVIFILETMILVRIHIHTKKQSRMMGE